eukprot:590925-Hanusia_phi.AAC.1
MASSPRNGIKNFNTRGFKPEKRKKKSSRTTSRLGTEQAAPAWACPECPGRAPCPADEGLSQGSRLGPGAGSEEDAAGCRKRAPAAPGLDESKSPKRQHPRDGEL